MGKDVYEKVVEIAFGDIIAGNFHKVRGEGDEVREVIFYDGKVPNKDLEHMCDYARGLVEFDQDYTELRGLDFKNVRHDGCFRIQGAYSVCVGDVVPSAKIELGKEGREKLTPQAVV